VNRIEHGAKLVEAAGRAMNELLTSVASVASLMGEIASAGREQSAGIEQINKAIAQMDQVVQMNASLVEEATAAASSMASQADELARSVARFRIEEGETPATPALASAPVAARVSRQRPAAIASPEQKRRALRPAGDEAEWQEF
jgi:methyl-accepting chemotaxis protein